MIASNDIHLWLSPHKGLGTEEFLREVLAHYLPLRPSQIRFARTTNGKPYLKDRRFSHLQFNASHSHGQLVCAISTGLLLGVDIENTRRKNSIGEIAERYFHPQEIQALQSIADEQQRRHLFFQLWTCKEAYIKARGLTIGTASLEHIGFTNDSGNMKALFPLPRHQQWFFHITERQDMMIAVAQARRTWQSGKPELILFDTGI